MIKHNSYFDEKVQSLGFEGKTQPVSVGVMEAGEYRFGTEAAERMQVITGALVVLLPGSSALAPGNLSMCRPTARLI